MRFTSLSGPGASLIEVVVSIGLFAVFASTLFVAMGSQLLTTVKTNQTLEALPLAREGLEAARTIRDGGWSSLATGTHGLVYTSSTWSFLGSSDTSGIYTRTITVTDTATSTERQVISTVSWLGANQQTQSIRLATNLSNWRSIAVAAGGGGGGSGSSGTTLTGAWLNPQTVASYDVGAGNKPTGLAIRNGILYLSGVAAASNKPDFFILDVRNLNSISTLSSLNTGIGANAIAINGDFAYMANNDTSHQLQIINFSTTSSPYVVSDFLLTGNSSLGYSIAVTGTNVLVGTANGASSPEFYIVDVSNPAIPAIRSSLEIGGDVNKIVLSGNRAYLATGSSSAELILLDLANLNVPTIATSTNLLSGNPALSLYVYEAYSRAYIGRQHWNTSPTGTSPELLLYNVVNPLAPTRVGWMEHGFGIKAMYAADNLVFLGTTDPNLELQIYNVTDPANPVYHSGVNVPQLVSDFILDNNYLYLIMRSNDGLNVITSE